MLKSIMPMQEYKKWMIYLKEDSPDVPELQIATLTTIVANGLGGKNKVSDFIIRKKDDTNRNKPLDVNTLRGAFGILSSKSE